MNTHPVNLTVRFLLEILMLVILGYRGWHLGEGWLSYALAVAFPLMAAVLWGVFRIPNDPKPAPVAIPGVARLLLEFFLFGAAVWSLVSMGYLYQGIALAVVVVIHYIVSWDRTGVMLQNKPYNGFTGKKIMGVKP